MFRAILLILVFLTNRTSMRKVLKYSLVSIVPLFIGIFLLKNNYFFSRKSLDSFYSYNEFIWDGKTYSSPLYIEKWQAEEDINRLVYTLEKAYIGGDFLDDEVKNAVQSLKKIPLNNSIEVSIFYEYISKVFDNISDLHANATFDAVCNIKNQRYSNNKNVGHLPWLVSLEKVDNDTSVLLIAITRFLDPSSHLWDGFLSSVEEKLPAASGVILDLRGNSGGNDCMGRKLADLLYGSSEWSWHVSKILFNNKSITLIMHANKIKELIECMKKTEANTDNLQKYYDNLVSQAIEVGEQKSSKKYIEREFSRSTINIEHIPKKPIFILMDMNCGSSGENMIDFLEDHPYALKIGENSAGAIHFGNVGFFLLPYSKIKISLGSQFKLYDDMRILEGKGIAPDYFITSIEAYEFVLDNFLTLAE